MNRQFRLGHQEYLFSLLAFISVAGMYLCCPWTHLHPQVWGDLASAFENADSLTVEHGLWRYFVNVLIRIAPQHLPQAMHYAGVACGAFCSAVTFILLHKLAPLMFRSLSPEIIRVRLLINVLILGLVWLLALSEGVWNLFRFLTVQSAQLSVIMFAILMLLNFLSSSHVRWLFICYFTLGLLAGNTVLGIFLALTVLVVLALAKRLWRQQDAYGYGYGGGYGDEYGEKEVLVEPNLPMPLLNPLVAERIKMPCAVVFLLGVMLSVGTDIAFSMRASDLPFGALMLNSALSYLKGFRAYADALDLVRIFLIVVLPLLANLWYCRRATDVEKFLPRRLSVLYAITACAAYTQISGCSSLWFWTWRGSVLLPSSPLCLAIVSFLAVLVLASSLMVFVVDSCCRDFNRLVSVLCSDAKSLRRDAEMHLWHPLVAGGRRLVLIKGWIFIIFVLFLCVASVPARIQAPQRTVIALIRDFAVEVAREAEACSRIVTNGSLDDALRISIFRGNGKARVVSAEHVACGEDVTGPNTGWMTDLPWCFLDGGWDFSGVLARRNVSAAERAVSHERVLALAERFVEFDRNGTVAKIPDRFLRSAADMVKWYLARTLNLYVQAADGKMSSAEAQRLDGLVQALDRSNTALQAVLAETDGSGTRTNLELTALEGLQVAVNRNDFELARRYVDSVLRSDPANAWALYAQGMIFLKDGQNARAAEALRRVVTLWPDEPAVINNLAVALQRVGKRDEAEACMRRLRKSDGTRR